MFESMERVPISIGGIILGITAMGNLLADYFYHSREICGLIAMILTIMVVIKLIYYPKYFKEDLDNPILASIIATFSMAFMLISIFIAPYVGINIAFAFWIFAILLHLFFLVNYIVKFIIKWNLSNFTAGSFVVFAGVQMIAITSSTFHQEVIGTIAFWFSFIWVIFIVLVTSFRYLKIPVATPVKPIIGVYAAPFSLCAVGYLAAVNPKNMMLILSLYVITKLCYVFVLYKFIEYRHNPIYPTYAAYTFPIVINAVTTLQVMTYLNSLNIHISFLHYEVVIEIVIAILMVLYVLYHFLLGIFDIEHREIQL